MKACFTLPWRRQGSTSRDVSAAERREYVTSLTLKSGCAVLCCAVLARQHQPESGPLGELFSAQRSRAWRKRPFAFVDLGERERESSIRSTSPHRKLSPRLILSHDLLALSIFWRFVSLPCLPFPRRRSWYYSVILHLICEYNHARGEA